MEPSEPVQVSARDEDGWRTAYYGAFLVTFLGGIILLAFDKGQRADTRAVENGESPDPILAWMGISFGIVLLLELLLTILVIAMPEADGKVSHRGLVIVWGLPALWLFLYLTVFQPH